MMCALAYSIEPLGMKVCDSVCFQVACFMFCKPVIRGIPERSLPGEGCFDAFNVPTALLAHNSGGIIPSCKGNPEYWPD